MKLITVCVLYYFQKWHTTQAIQGLPLFDHRPPLQVCIQAKVKEGIAGGLINNSDSACWILSKPTLWCTNILLLWGWLRPYLPDAGIHWCRTEWLWEEPWGECGQEAYPGLLNMGHIIHMDSLCSSISLLAYLRKHDTIPWQSELLLPAELEYHNACAALQELELNKRESSF